MGGTFTDVIATDSLTGRVNVLKLPTSVDPSSAVVEGLSEIGRPAEVSLVSHATTLATNALLTRAGLAKTALITNEGFRDVLEIGRQRRPEVYDLLTSRPPPLVSRRHRFTLRARMGHDGRVLAPLDGNEAVALARRIVRGRFKSVAVSFVNSYSNPEHEESVRQTLKAEGFRGHITLSNETDREFREYERTSTAVVNAVLQPLVSTYLRGLSKSLGMTGVRAPVYVMNSDGGMATLASAAERPFAAIESGPAAGVLASKELASSLGMRRVITFDMGGTTAKAGVVVDGEPDVTYEFEAAGRTHSGRSIRGSGYAVRGPFIDLAEVSAGGGTIASVDDAGSLVVGPRSSGSSPGPACYGRGGVEPTVTDANVILGRLNPTHLLGGRMKMTPRLARRAFANLASRVGVTVEETAVGVLRLVNNSMARAISMVSVERGRDPRDFSMIAFGGAGPVHVCDLGEDLGIREIFVPMHAGLFSAYGLLAADLTRTFTLPAEGPLISLRHRFAELDRLAARQMRREGARHYTTRRYVDLRYVGQSHELTVPYEGGPGLQSSFDAMHARLYGYSSDDEVEAVSVRLKATVERSAPASIVFDWAGPRTTSHSRKAWLGGRFLSAEVRTREGMRRGDRGAGPCIIEEYDSTLTVNAGWTWKIEERGTRLSR